MDAGKNSPFAKPSDYTFLGLPRLDISRDSSGISGWTGIEHVIPDFAILTVRSDIEIRSQLSRQDCLIYLIC